MHRILAEAPKAGYRCPQRDYLNLDENGNIVTCCQIARDHPDYSCGNALEGDLAAMLQQRTRQAVCGGCIRSGLAFYLNTALQRPDFYRPSIRQRLRRLRHRLHNLSFEKLGRFARKSLALPKP